MYHLFPREIMTNTKKIDILKTLTNKKELIKKDLQELNDFICPKYQQAASEIPAPFHEISSSLEQTGRSPAQRNRQPYTENTF